MIEPKKTLHNVWKKFDNMPMETLTKAWNLKYHPETRQRSVGEIQRHCEKTGAPGNCFDLAYWLWSELKRSNIQSYPICNEDLTHVAILATEDEKRYYCDLGDSWIKPILIEPSDPHFQKGFHRGFFPGAEVEITQQNNGLEITYQRSNGKQSQQRMNLDPLSEEQFLEAANLSQRTLKRPLIEKRIKKGEETVIWEFDNFKSFTSSLEGLIPDNDLKSHGDWAKRISNKTGMNFEFLNLSLQAYLELSQSGQGH